VFFLICKRRKYPQIYLKGLDNIDNNYYIYSSFDFDSIGNSIGRGMARIVIENVPEEIRAGFKAICTVHKTTMRKELLKHITFRVGQEIKLTREGLVVRIY
jgi:hypothetical protein